MSGLDFPEMLRMQRELQDHYLEQWGGLSPQKGRDSLLWMIIEAGEAADVIKKRGDDCIMEDEEQRRHFIEEMCDVMMYFNDVLLCYGVTAEDFRDVYLAKHRRNMHRWDASEMENITD